MASQVEIIQDDKAKRKSATNTQEAVEELAYLMIFNQSIKHDIARTMEELSNIVLSTWRISLWSTIATWII